MKILLVTEKCSPNAEQKDGGARLVETLKSAFKESLSIMQFGTARDTSPTWRFDYPFDEQNRFKRRLANAHFIAEKIKAVENSFTHVVFIHISMQFGLVSLPLREDVEIWTFPMFLTPSYQASGEIVPHDYTAMEKLALAHSKIILSPSQFERRQLTQFYSIAEERIHVVPRGIDTKLLAPHIRTLDGPPQFCSIGSIKPQKNTLGLLRLFDEIQARHPGSSLRIIGPIQDQVYYEKVCAEIEKLRLQKLVECKGHIPPTDLPMSITDAHIHLSTSLCETFGRSIFETLASGLPNIARKTGNAAAEFLQHVPYAQFVDDNAAALDAIDAMLAQLPQLSAMAIEIGSLYDDEILSQLLAAKIGRKEILAISDFDGTLFHKDNPEKTVRCINAFRKFPARVICSARPLQNLQQVLKFYNLEVDWIIASSGSVVSNTGGEILWLTPLEPEDISAFSEAKRIELAGQVLQLAMPITPDLLGLRFETYEGTTFVAHWKASKLRAACRLLRHIRWEGQVRVFGDGPYDAELLTYFDGTLITPLPQNNLQKQEIEYA